MLTVEPAMIWAATLMLVTVRVVGMMLFAPVFSNSAVPMKLRVVVGVAMGLAVVGRLAGPVPLPPGWFDLAMAAGCELLIGGAIGYAAGLIFTGVELGAFHISSQMGLSLADVINPLKSGSPQAAGGLFRMLAVVVFLAIGGHRAMIGGLLETFDTVPPLGLTAPGAVLKATVAMLGASFVLALKLAGPVLIAMLVAMVALGMLHKTVPQCNLLSVGLPARAMLGLLAVACSLGVLAPLLEAATARLSRNIQMLTAAVR
ncbi:MAG: flagellar biosynthetic protein FliR [Phycisphaerae bacterium]